MSDPNLILQRQVQDIQDVLERLRKADTTIYAASTWTPVLVGSTIAGTFTYLVQSGNYTRIGNRVWISGRIALSAVSVAPTGNLSITGLPITATTVTSGTPGGAHFDFWSKVNIGGGAKVYLGGWIQNNQAQIDLYVSDSAGGVVVTLTGATAGVANGTDITFQGQYQV